MVDGRFPFQVGPTRAGNALGVVRLGGHREGKETGWQCAAREAYEEATLHITAIRPPATYWYATASSGYPALLEDTWPAAEIEPILVGRHLNRSQITPIYLAVSNDTPVPAHETKGLLLLAPADIARIVGKGMTLGQYLNAGGKAIMQEELPLHLRLEPFPHLKLLQWVLQKHPGILQ
ncbi:NUDIX hydrolase [Brevibacillus brevis]|uniref:NUDIX hydrolase n=1 Tax=Brevibacillus brevis TaxID=1393 RepID=A0ABY9SWQ1_BREBE|nr:NUDIX hydrolase [Brevibacillus brevis]WNC12241.1 NUDIX hydrolase [Brevibacillus brevis]